MSLTALAWIAAGGSAMRALGNMEAAGRAEDDAKLQRRLFEIRGREAKKEAGRQVAISQRGALEARRQSRLVSSRLLAVSAASGASASDSTVTRLMADAQAEGDYRAAIALYEGLASERALLLRAASERVSGATAFARGISRAEQHRIRMLGNIIGGGSSLYARYGGGDGDPRGDAALINDPMALAATGTELYA